MTQREQQPIEEIIVEILDTALARLESGEPLEVVLASYPDYSDQIARQLAIASQLYKTIQQPLPEEFDSWVARGRVAFADAVARELLQPAVSFESVLDSAISRMRAGVPLATILADNPDHADQLKPLLETVGNLQQAIDQPVPRSIETWLPRGRRAFATVVAREKRRITNTSWRIRQFFSLPRMAAGILAGALVFGTVDGVSAQSLPGEPLYSWKQTREEIALNLATSPEQRSQLHIEYVQRRLSEIERLVANDPASKQILIDQTVANLLAHARLASDEASRTSDTELVTEISDQLGAATKRLDNAAMLDPQAGNELVNARTVVGNLATNPPKPIVRPTTSTNSTPTRGLIVTPTATSAGTPTTSDAQLTPTDAVTGIQEGTPTATSSQNRRPSATPTPTATATVARSTATPTSTSSSLPLPSTRTATPTRQLPTATQTLAATPTPTSTPPPTATPVVETEQPTDQLPPSPLPTQRPPRPTNTPTETDTPTITPTETDTPTITPTETDTPVPTETPTPTDIPPTPTEIPTPTPVDTPIPTDIPTSTSIVVAPSGA